MTEFNLDLPTPRSTCTNGSHVSGLAVQGGGSRIWLDDSLCAQVGAYNPATNPFTLYNLRNTYVHPHDGLNPDPALHVWWDEEFNNALGQLCGPDEQGHAEHEGGNAGPRAQGRKNDPAQSHDDGRQGGALDEQAARVLERRRAHTPPVVAGACVRRAPARVDGVGLWERSGAAALPSATALREWRSLLLDTYPWYRGKVCSRTIAWHSSWHPRMEISRPRACRDRGGSGRPQGAGKREGSGREAGGKRGVLE